MFLGHGKTVQGDLRLLQCHLFGFSLLLYVIKGLRLGPDSPGLHFNFLVEVIVEDVRCYLPCYKDLSEQATPAFHHLWGGAWAPKDLGWPSALGAFPGP